MYIKIKGNNLYLSNEVENYYVDKARKDLNISSDEMINLMIHSRENTKKTNRIWKRIYKLLEMEYRSSPKEFLDKLMYFDVDREQAKDPMITNRILWSYSCAFGHCHVMSVKYENDRYVHDYAADNWPYIFPGGKNVAIVHRSVVPNIFRKYIYKMENRTYFTMFNIEDIEEIKGKLDDFYIQFSNGRKITFMKQEIYDDNKLIH